MGRQQPVRTGRNAPGALSGMDARKTRLMLPGLALVSQQQASAQDFTQGNEIDVFTLDQRPVLQHFNQALGPSGAA